VRWRCTQKTKHLIDAGAQQFGPEVLYAELKQKRRVLLPFSRTLSRTQVHSTLIFLLLPLLPSRPPYRCLVFAPTLQPRANQTVGGVVSATTTNKPSLANQRQRCSTTLCCAAKITRHTRMSSSETKAAAAPPALMRRRLLRLRCRKLSTIT
jgi:hypothetical protein